MADAELETFTSIMDALVRISVSTTLMSIFFLPAFIQTVCAVIRHTGTSSPSLLIRPACYSVRPIKHMVQIVTEEFIAIRFPSSSISKSVYIQAVSTKRLRVWPRMTGELHLQDVANKPVCA